MILKMLVCRLSTVLVFVSFCVSFNVLVAIPGTIRSLHSLFSEVVLGLADAGHHVTFITSFPLTPDHSNVNVIDSFLLSAVNIFELGDMANIAEVADRMQKEWIEKTWSHPDIIDQWKRRKEFDLIILTSYHSEFLFPFLLDNDGVFVQMCTPGFEAVSLSREGNWVVPSSVPNILSDYDGEMSFWERALNLKASIDYYLFQKRLTQSKQESLNALFPQLGELESYYDRAALTLINAHFALDGPIPLLPSQIEIGTITAKKPKPLAKELEEFMKSSGEAGVVYFSLGSIAKSTDIPAHAKTAFVKAFRKIPQKVIWKYEGDDLDLPPNVLIKSWLPQQDILGHPKTRVFISHCGNIGTQEAKYHGVPVLAVPIAFDQPRNAARMERKGLAITLHWDEITTEKILETLAILLHNSVYKERLENLSRVLQDQKESPVERAVYWLEYVVKHKGAPQLEYAGKRLSLFQYLLLDVVLFFVGLAFLILFMIILIVVILVRMTISCRNGGKKRSKKKKS